MKIVDRIKILDMIKAEITSLEEVKVVTDKSTSEKKSKPLVGPGLKLRNKKTGVNYTVRGLSILEGDDESKELVVNVEDPEGKSFYIKADKNQLDKYELT